MNYYTTNEGGWAMNYKEFLKLGCFNNIRFEDSKFYLFLGVWVKRGVVNMRHTPFLVVLHITGKCNLKCSYCYANQYDPINLKFAYIKDVLEQAKK